MNCDKYAPPEYSKYSELFRHVLYYGIIMIVGVGIVAIGSLLIG